MTLFGRRQLQSLVVLFLLLAGMAYWGMRGSDDPETVIEGIVEELVEAAEHKKIGPFKEYLSDRFEDEQGRSKEEVLNILRMIFLRHPTISLHIFSLSFSQSSNPTVKQVDLTLLMSETTLPQDRGKFQITFRQTDGDWKIWEARWGEGYGYGTP